jgi:transcriptional regulator GlxA family with amidase domain
MSQKVNERGAQSTADSPPDRRARAPSHPPTRVGILLTPDFILLSYAAVTEAMRAANALADAQLYQWWNITPDGRTVCSATGAEIPAVSRMGDDLKIDLLLIIGSTTEIFHPNKAIIAWLRRIVRQGVRIAGISVSGVQHMAAAGLLDGHRCAIHWLHTAAFGELFPNVTIEPALYVVDGNLMSCVGSGAALDLMCGIIEAEHGAELAQDVNDWLTHGSRSRMAQQRRSVSERVPGRSRPLLRAVTEMESNIEETLSREDLAVLSGVSLRQLERLFAQHLGTTMVKYYRLVRLNHARELLRNPALSVGNIALASGFSSLSYFSRAFKAQFGYAPTTRRSHL